MMKSIPTQSVNHRMKHIFALALVFVMLISCVAYAEDIKRGDKGDSVTEIQNLLAEKGYPVGTVDGIFGGGTEKCVKAFQADNGLKETGIVDSLTYEKLIGWADCEHSYGEWIITQEPDCTTPGIRMHTCSKCGKYEYEDIPPTGHILVKSPDSNDKVCSICGMIDGEITIGSTVSKEKHSFEVLDAFFADGEVRIDGNHIYSADSYIFVIELNFTNLSTEEIPWTNSRRLKDLELTYDNKYKYSGSYWIPADDDKIIPLSTKKLCLTYTVADAVVNNPAPIVARFTIDGEKYVLRK